MVTCYAGPDEVAPHEVGTAGGVGDTGTISAVLFVTFGAPGALR